MKYQHFHLLHSTTSTRNKQISSTTSPPPSATTTIFPTTTPNTLRLTTTETSINIPKYHSQSKIGQSQSLRSTQQIARKAIKSSPAATNSTTLRSHKTDAPMLNYIFDSHLATNKHHHHDR